MSAKITQELDDLRILDLDSMNLQKHERELILRVVLSLSSRLRDTLQRNIKLQEATVEAERNLEQADKRCREALCTTIAVKEDVKQSTRIKMNEASTLQIQLRSSIAENKRLKAEKRDVTKLHADCNRFRASELSARQELAACRLRLSILRAEHEHASQSLVVARQQVIDQKEEYAYEFALERRRHELRVAELSAVSIGLQQQLGAMCNRCYQ